MAPGRLSITQVSPQGARQLALNQRNKSPPPARNNNNEEYMCYMQDDCTFKSKSVDGVGDHVKKEHLNLKEGLGCVFENCTFRGTAMPEMKNHYSSVHESKESREAERTTCLLCGARRRTEGEVMRHIRIVHLKDNEYLCNACPQGKYATFSLKEWANHVHQNHADNPPKIEFRRQEGFDPSKRLPMTAQPVPEEVVDLTDIPEDPKTKSAANKTKAATTPSGRGKNQTQLALTGPDDKPGVQFKCFHCPEKFTSKEVLLAHNEKAHDGKGMDDIKSATGTNVSQIYDFLCMLCDKKTQTDDDIKKHVIATHFKTFQAICPHCPHVASSPADLQNHGQTEHYKHFSLSKLLCSKCDYTSKNVEVMQTHTSKAHGIEIKKKDGEDVKGSDGETKKEEKDKPKEEEPKSETKTSSGDVSAKKEELKTDIKTDEKISSAEEIKPDLSNEAKKDEKKPDVAETSKDQKKDSNEAAKNNDTNAKDAPSSGKTEDKDEGKNKESSSKSGESKAEEKVEKMETEGKSSSKDTSPAPKKSTEESKDNKSEKKTEDTKKDEQVTKTQNESSEKANEKTDAANKTGNKTEENSSSKKEESKEKTTEKESKQTDEEKNKKDKEESVKSAKDSKSDKESTKAPVEKDIEDEPLRRSTRSSGSSSSNENNKNEKTKESKKTVAKPIEEPPLPKKLRLSEPSKGLSKSGNNFDAPLDLF